MSLETDCGNAIITVLNIDTTLAAVPPRLWNDSSEAEMPRIAVKARQGAEIAAGLGMYVMACEVIFVSRVLTDVTDEWMDRARALINDRAAYTTYGQDQGAEILLTNGNFVCKGVIPTPASGGNDGDKRTQTLAFDAIGFTLARLNASQTLNTEQEVPILLE